MKTSTRKILDKSFDVLSRTTLALLVIVAAVFIVPIAVKGVGAVIFSATVEHDKFRRDNLDAELSAKDEQRIAQSDAARVKLYSLMETFESSEGASQICQTVKMSSANAIKSLSAHSDELRQALDLSPRERSAKASAISKKIFGGFSKTLSQAADDALRDGVSLGFAEFVAGQKIEITAAIKTEIDKICKGATVSKRASIRRGILSCALESLNNVYEKLSQSNAAYLKFKEGVEQLLGPRDEKSKSQAMLMRQKYGQTRADVARKVFASAVAKLSLKVKDADGHEVMANVKTKDFFAGTNVAKMLDIIESDFDKILGIHTTFYGGFFTDNPIDANIFGGIYPMIMGTFYLTFAAMFIAAPLGIIAAIYFSEYAGNGKIVGLLRVCVGTLAGVPSIVFGLFGLAFIINTLKISDGKSVMAGSLTLALLILPTIIRSSEEAIKAVPNSYREASLALGAGKWRAICGVVLPAALPSILTGVIISMGRAAGETAPIIFTAATSTGIALGLAEIFTQPTPALPWNIYNICSEHELAERVEHVQYGMVFTLMAIVIALNLVAIWARAKLKNKLK